MKSQALAWERTPPFVFDGGRLSLLDQTLLPFAEQYLELSSADDCARAIREMRVRGAPLIGLVAAAGMVFAVRDDPRDGAIDEAASMLLASRPTAVNLGWAIARMRAVLAGVSLRERGAAADMAVRELQRAEYACCERIGGHGFGLLAELAMTERVRRRGRLEILTHCNAGWLATGAWGTALAPVYRASARGIELHVWVDETRPRNQGARLTAWELAQAGIAHTVIADNCAGHLMQHGMVDACLVGCDRASARGDVCNKIGTYQKALAATDNALPFYVALPGSTFDWGIEDGLRETVIEERDGDEVLFCEGMDDSGVLRRVRSAAPASSASNFAFDVTPARLVSALICEHGVFAPTPAELARLRAVAA